MFLFFLYISNFRLQQKNLLSKGNNKEWLLEGLILKNNKKLKYRSEHSNL